MKITFTLLASLFFIGNSFSQVLGIYEFTGTGACPNQNPAITAQPTGATFSVMNSVGTTCVVTNNVYNASGWNPATTIDLTKYHEFAITADNGKLLVLDSLIFASRISTNTAKWYLRSDVDNFATDLSMGDNTATLDTFRVKLPVSHQGIQSVNFRFYVSSVTDDQRAWRIDDVTTKGLIVNSNLSVTKLENESFSIFPNPGNDNITIANKNNLTDVKVTFITSDGKIVKESLNETVINVNSLEKGIYFIRISEANHVSTFTWLKN
ncbi:MAG: T9SS type A sorting domain-containing protein [Flavobacteriia bacterium]